MYKNTKYGRYTTRKKKGAGEKKIIIIPRLRTKYEICLFKKKATNEEIFSQSYAVCLVSNYFDHGYCLLRQYQAIEQHKKTLVRHKIKETKVSTFNIWSHALAIEYK